MKKLFFTTMITLMFLGSSAYTAQAQNETDTQPNRFLCLPETFSEIHTDCQPDGPAAFLNQQYTQNITFPMAPIPASQPDFNLTYANTAYAEVRTTNAPVYGSIDDALTEKKKNAIERINASFSYVSYFEETVIDGKRFYQIAPGQWMSAIDVTRVTPPRFQGYTFTQTPTLPFGWVLNYLSPTPQVQTKQTPGYQTDDYSDQFLKHHSLVWIYQTELIGDTEWYLVGPNQWVPQNVIGRVIPNPTPPQGVTGNRWIDINLFEQTMAVYENNELVFATLIASGLEPFWTRPGLFQIYEKLDTTPMSGAFEADRSDAYYLQDVPWTLYFDEKRAIHGAYWRSNLGFPQSHGCVNMSIGDAQWIYLWAELGDWVYVWDPSGKTPIDPDVYTDGGA